MEFDSQKPMSFKRPSAENKLKFLKIDMLRIEISKKLISKNKPDVFIMYDDRFEHLSKFVHWAKTQPCEIHIIDVINKTTKIVNK
jgi:hypothetical protein